MNAFQTGTACVTKPDPLKRMNYTFGMVLGADEFNQEQVYLRAKDSSQYRLAHGYGTLYGLRVSIDTSPVLQVRIAKGVAVNPRGQEIHVCQEMCARINDWLVSNQSALHEVLGSPPLPMSLCVALCYRDCPTDSVPVPGEPCRSQQDAMAPSHIAESFQLKLCLDFQNLSPAIGSPASAAAASLCFRPDQLEEDATRAFGDLLRRIRLTDIPPSSVSRTELENMVRELAAGPPLVTSPEPSGPIHLFVDDAPDYLRAAYLVWVTEVRPTFQIGSGGCGCGCGCAAPAEDCVLLAELQFNVVAGWQVSGPIAVDETRRPYLVETRLLQENLFSRAAGGATGVTAGSAVVAAGTFAISGSSVTASGPVFNGLQATPQLTAGQYLLSWTGSPAYTNPSSSSPGTHTYVVKGTALAGVPDSSPYVVQVLAFQNAGILIAVQGTRGNDPAAGFAVEISEVTGGFA